MPKKASAAEIAIPWVKKKMYSYQEPTTADNYFRYFLKFYWGKYIDNMKLPKPYLIGKSNIEDVEAKSLERKNLAKNLKWNTTKRKYCEKSLKWKSEIFRENR